MNWKGRKLAGAALLLHGLFTGSSAIAAAQTYAGSSLIARVNGALDEISTSVIRHQNGRLFARPEAFARWGLRMPTADLISYAGEQYLPLDGVAGLTYMVDEQAREVLIAGSPRIFFPRVTEAGATVPASTHQIALAPASFAMSELEHSDVAESPDFSEIWLVARVNGVEQPTPILAVRHHNGRLFTLPETFVSWRMQAPPQGGLTLNGETVLPLDGVEGLTYMVDERTQKLVVEGRPASFAPSIIAAPGAPPAKPTLGPSGGFFNYDLQYLNQEDQQDVSGLFELGLFNNYGVATSTFLGQKLDDGSGLTRLETTWTHDWPERRQTARWGDAINRAGAWGRPVRFGGVQWGTNFATQPYFVPFPLPTIEGEAALPSTIDVFSDNAQRLSDEVPPGPFVIPNLPVTNGAGEVTLVVRDLLGREQVITQPYYVSQALLRKGVRDYSYELGLVREDFGLRSNEYGRVFAAGTHRAGITDRFTGELHAELLEDQQTAGVAGNFLWAALGTANAAIAASQRDSDPGGLVSFGFDRVGRRLSYGLQSQFTTGKFAQLGLQPDEPAPRQTTTAHIGFPLTGQDSISLGYLHQDNRDDADSKFLTLSYGVGLGGNFYLSAFALKGLTGGAGDSIGAVLTRPFGERTTASASLFQQDGGSSAELALQRNLPPGRGAGYRLIAGAGENSRDAASLFYQNDVGVYGAEAARFQGSNALRLNAAGSLAVVDGKGFLSRWLDDSFGVVKVADYPNVQIYAENQPIARTGPDGTALVPRLRAFQTNHISIEQADLPMDAQVDAVELDAVPAFRSGVMVDFPVRAVNGALLTLVREDGSPVPAGAIVTRAGESEEFIVAMRGEVYATGLVATNWLQVAWDGGGCLIEVERPTTADPLPLLGPFVCGDARLAERTVEINPPRQEAFRSCQICQRFEDICRDGECSCDCSLAPAAQRVPDELLPLSRAVVRP